MNYLNKIFLLDSSLIDEKIIHHLNDWHLVSDINEQKKLQIKI